MSIVEFLFTGPRAKSFYWRAGVGLGLLYCAHLSQLLPSLELPEFAAIAAIYAINELTKWLNRKKEELPPQQ